MKAENALFISVIIRNDAVSVTDSFNFSEAKENMINMLNIYFNHRTDEGLIFKSEGEGKTDAIFNYRAYLNKEPDHYEQPQKENRNIKIFFECPKCHGHEFKIVPDEDGDLFANCKNKECNHYELIQS